jgi:hypothetical protein
MFFSDCKNTIFSQYREKRCKKTQLSKGNRPKNQVRKSIESLNQIGH